MSFKTDKEISGMINAYKATLGWSIRQKRDKITAKTVCGGEFKEQIFKRAKKESQAFNDHLRKECENRGIVFSEDLLDEAITIKKQIEGRKYL